MPQTMTISLRRHMQHAETMHRPERMTTRLTEWINLTAAGIVITTLIAMFAVVLLNVLLRYLLGEGVTWAYEIPALLFPWTVAGGLVMATAQGRNIAVDAINGMLPEKWRHGLAVAVQLATCLICVIVVCSAMPIIEASSYSRLAETGIAQVYGYCSLLYAFSMVAILALLRAVDLMTGRQQMPVDPTASNFS